MTSNRNKKEPSICFTCGHEYMARSYKVRNGTAKYCSLSCSAVAGAKAKLKKYSQSGSANPNWKGGVSSDAMRYTSEYKKNNPEKVRAHNLVMSAIRSGELLQQPCEVCGKDKVDAHHDDYSKPLNVRWLCRKHHIEHHKT